MRSRHVRVIAFMHTCSRTRLYFPSRLWDFLVWPELNSIDKEENINTTLTTKQVTHTQECSKLKMENQIYFKMPIEIVCKYAVLKIVVFKLLQSTVSYLWQKPLLKTELKVLSYWNIKSKSKSFFCLGFIMHSDSLCIFFNFF